MGSFLDGLGRKTTVDCFHSGGIYPRATEALNWSRMFSTVDSGSCLMTSGNISSGPGFLLFFSFLMAMDILCLVIHSYVGSVVKEVGIGSSLDVVRMELGKCSNRSSCSDSCVLVVIEPSLRFMCPSWKVGLGARI